MTTENDKTDTPLRPIVTSPVFIPLKSEYYEAFCDGSKTVEYRQYGQRWNERTCQVGRRVTISKGYGKQNRRKGTIVGFLKRRMSSDSWIDCYGEPGEAACIEIRLDSICGKCGDSCCHCSSLRPVALMPSHVMAVESLRKSPYSRMFGCAEFEYVAKVVIAFLCENGNRWDTTIPLDDLCQKWDLNHGHGDSGEHVFRPRYAVDGKVTDAFIRTVTRRDDYSQFQDDAIRRLVPDWPLGSDAK